jgi:AcrR family transcriptional regulator
MQSRPRTQVPTMNGPVAMGQSTKASERTRTRILDAAEHLFAEHGVEGTSLRRIMAIARVSISQINYHFGSREALLRAVFVRRAGPHIEARLRLLDKARQAPIERRLEAVIDSYFAPVEWITSGRADSVDFHRLLARIGADPGELARSMLAEFYDDFQHQVIEELKRLLPEVSEADIYWRWHCMLAILMYSTTNVNRLRAVSRGRYDLRDSDAFFEHVIPFLVAGMRLPSPTAKRRGARSRRRYYVDNMPEAAPSTGGRHGMPR